MDIYKGVLTLEEKILLSSLRTSDKDKAIFEVEDLMMSTPTDDEAHPLIMSLHQKLTEGYVNITEELSELENELGEELIAENGVFIGE